MAEVTEACEVAVGLNRAGLAERVGFEPTMGCPIRHFQCRALGL
jgi:hypothetical protein